MTCADKSLWVTAEGTFGGKEVAVSLDAGIGIGGTVTGGSGEISIADYIAEQYGKVQTAEGNTYPTRLVAGILDEVLTSTVTLSLTADAAAAQGFDLLGVAKQMVGGIVNLGDTALELVAQQNSKPVSIDLVLALDGAMTADNVNLDMISLKLNYVTVDKTTTLIGIYVCDGNLWLDLSGIGMGAVNVAASEVINKLTGYLGSLVGGFDIDAAMEEKRREMLRQRGNPVACGRRHLRRLNFRRRYFRRASCGNRKPHQGAHHFGKRGKCQYQAGNHQGYYQ